MKEEEEGQFPLETKSCHLKSAFSTFIGVHALGEMVLCVSLSSPLLLLFPVVLKMTETIPESSCLAQAYRMCG